MSQVVHAASDGLMYGALRLITGSLWPVILLHGLWDLGATSVHATLQAQGGAAAQALTSAQVGGVHISPMQIFTRFVIRRIYSMGLEQKASRI